MCRNRNVCRNPNVGRNTGQEKMKDKSKCVLWSSSSNRCFMVVTYLLLGITSLLNLPSQNHFVLFCQSAVMMKVNSLEKLCYFSYLFNPCTWNQPRCLLSDFQIVLRHPSELSNRRFYLIWDVFNFSHIDIRKYRNNWFLQNQSSRSWKNRTSFKLLVIFKKQNVLASRVEILAEIFRYKGNNGDQN